MEQLANFVINNLAAYLSSLYKPNISRSKQEFYVSLTHSLLGLLKTFLMRKSSHVFAQFEGRRMDEKVFPCFCSH